MTNESSVTDPVTAEPLARGWRNAFLPAQWLRTYKSQRLLSDAIAGVTLAAFGIPLSLAYASLVGCHRNTASRGISSVGRFYAPLCSSRQLAFGPTIDPGFVRVSGSRSSRRADAESVSGGTSGLRHGNESSRSIRGRAGHASRRGARKSTWPHRWARLARGPHRRVPVVRWRCRPGRGRAGFGEARGCIRYRRRRTASPIRRTPDSLLFIRERLILLQSMENSLLS